MNWYILVVTSKDWYTYYHNTYLVRAESEIEAERKVEAHPKFTKNITKVTTTITCGKRQPKADSDVIIIK